MMVMMMMMMMCGATSRWGEHVQHGRLVDFWCNGDIAVKRGLYDYGDDYDDASDNDGGDNDDGDDNEDYDGTHGGSAKNNSSNNGGDDGSFEVKSKASNKGASVLANFFSGNDNQSLENMWSKQPVKWPFLTKIITPEFTQVQRQVFIFRYALYLSKLAHEKMINMTVNDAHVNLARH